MTLCRSLRSKPPAIAAIAAKRCVRSARAKCRAHSTGCLDRRSSAGPGSRSTRAGAPGRIPVWLQPWAYSRPGCRVQRRIRQGSDPRSGLWRVDCRNSTDIPGGLIALFSIAIGCFYCYMPIDAYRVAKARTGKAEPGGIVESIHGGQPIGAIVLIDWACFSFSRNFGFLDRRMVSRTWPIALIAVGVWMVWDRIKKPS